MVKECRTCEHCRQGQCFAHPPVPIMVNGNIEGMLPPVSPNGTCGEHKLAFEYRIEGTD